MDSDRSYEDQINRVEALIERCRNQENIWNMLAITHAMHEEHARKLRESAEKGRDNFKRTIAEETARLTELLSKLHEDQEQAEKFGFVPEKKAAHWTDVRRAINEKKAEKGDTP